jgi:hypothetical protein
MQRRDFSESPNSRIAERDSHVLQATVFVFRRKWRLYLRRVVHHRAPRLTSRRAEEIDDVRTDRLLPAKAKFVHLPAPKQRPHLSLGVCGFVSQLSRDTMFECAPSFRIRFRAIAH